ncbi:tetratricopeptide repeat protein [Candidatus Acetothermia bacterium]|nr:tetratricopeptide repeat protein [Candidatus Acetothermia bacterium]
MSEIALRVKLFGRFEIWLGDVTIPPQAWPQRKTQLLVKLLLSERGRFFTQDQLIESLFSDHELEKAARSLHRRVSELRHVLEPHLQRGADSRFILHTGVKGYCFSADAPCQTDTEEFQKQSEAAQEAERAGRWAQALQGYEQAIALYRSDFLEEDLYEEWTIVLRERWRASYLHALARLAECYARLRQFGRAIECCERVLEKEPWHEGIYRQKMLYHYHAGEYSQALQTYQACTEVLKTHLEVGPTPQTQELYEQMLRHDVPTLPQVFPNNLPRPLSSFIGREQEIVEIKTLLAGVGAQHAAPLRLVTLTGIGGCGKTRLALRVASELLKEFPDGVWWVELAALANSVLVPQAVASAVGVREQPNRPLTELLADAFRLKKSLLVLDNCEHLIGACAELAEMLLHACPDLRILATSREALSLTGETVWTVPPLSIPTPALLSQETTNVVAQLKQYEAIDLFQERARSSQSGFALTQENAFAVAQICQRLDGLPLAIELAATRTKVLSVEQIARRLDDRFQLLTGGSRTALPHHQTLQATMDWSFQLLSEPERILLRHLSVFVGGFTLEAVEDVCADDGPARGDSRTAPTEILDLLTHLVDKSLVVVQPGVRARYRLLEIVRQFGREKLLESGEEPAVRQRHLGFFLQLAERAEPELKGANQTIWLELLAVEHDNLRAALSRSLECNEEEMGLSLAVALERFWYVRGYWSEGRQWLEKLLSLGSDASPPLRARALHATGILAWEQGHYKQANGLHEKALALRRELGDKGGVAISLNSLGLVAWNQGDHATARSYYEESLTIARNLGHKRICANVLNNLGIIANEQRDYVKARSLGGEALALWRELGDKPAIAMVLHNLGLTAQSQGDYAAARALYEEGLAIWKELGDKSTAYSLLGLGQVACRQGDYVRAWSLMKESLSIRREIGDKRGIARCLEDIADLAAAKGELERAARLLGAAEALRHAIGASLSPSSRADYDRIVTAVRAGLGEEAFAAARAHGRAMTLEQVIAFAQKYA